jgi:hypothetical protein
MPLLFSLGEKLPQRRSATNWMTAKARLEVGTSVRNKTLNLLDFFTGRVRCKPL